MPFAEDRGRRIHYRDTGGAGPPVVLIHGFPLNSTLWRPQEEALGDRYRLILPDLMGFGKSNVPDDPSEYSVDGFARNVLTVMDDAGLNRAVVGGLSMGGYVVFALWRLARERLAAMILADTRAEPDDEAAKARRTAQQERLRAEGTSKLIDETPAALMSDVTRERKPDVVAGAQATMDNPVAGWIGALEAMKRRPDSTADLSSIDVPALILTGELDPLTPPSVARSMHEQIGGSRLVVVPDAGHFSNIESAPHFSGAVAEFLAEAA